MQVIIINDDMYDVEPAVAAYIKQLERDKLDLQEGFYKLIAKQIAKIDELKAENEKLKKAIQSLPE